MNEEEKQPSGGEIIQKTTESNSVVNKAEALILKITGPDQTNIEIKVRFTTKVQRLLEAYANQKGMQPKEVKLIDPEGNLLNATSTIGECGLEDGDVLSVMMHQVGGAKLDVY